MYRTGPAAAAAAAARLRPPTPLRAWNGTEPPGTGPGGQRRWRYRARPLDVPPPPPCVPPRLCALSPPEGLPGDITTVDGRREDDIIVREGGSRGSLPLPPPLQLLLRAPNPLLSPPEPPRAPPEPPPPTMEEHLAVMHQKLQHELPNFFLKIPDYALYSPDVEFIHPHLRLHTRGKPLYVVALALCRLVAWGYFVTLRLEVLALTQHPPDWSIRARWRLTGLPLHLALLRGPRRDQGHLLRSYDAFSTFFLNSQGLIRCHRVDKVMPAPTPVPEAKKLLVAAGVAVATAGDT